MRRTLVTLSLATTMLVGAGCVPQEKYDELLTAYRAKEQQVLELNERLSGQRADADMMRRQLTDARGDLDRLEGLSSEQVGELDAMMSDYEALNARLANVRMGPLPAELSAALTGLASRYSDVLAFDAGTGMVRFASDVTFALGSTDLSGDAQRAIAALATILNGEYGSSFEARVVGHTDAVPIRRPATLQKHPTNLHLSVDRAISVRDALVAAGVQAGRVEVAGFGPYRPAVAGGGAQPANRRVEIYLQPLTATVAASPGAGGSAPAATGGAREVDYPLK